ncbi:MAG: phytanoyl-CoA dioxygenase family protein [Bdellovibrionales bacterium]|nr:phytanoyl-CoA dioxygenase family protein [Bdellovibrionales bacterium]
MVTIAQHLKNIKNNGWSIVEQAISHNLIDRFLEDLTVYKKTQKLPTTPSSYDYQGRVSLVHTEIESALELIMNQTIVKILESYWSNKPILFGSLTFTVSSQQRAHHDAHFVFTKPENAMMGVWIALEQVSIDAGPLFYFSGSHIKHKLKAIDVLRNHPLLFKRLISVRDDNVDSDKLNLIADEIYHFWREELDRRTALANETPRLALLKKGDVFFIHPWLIHGAIAIKNKDLTRKSIVGHFIASKDTSVWPRSDFLINGDRLKTIAPLKLSFTESRFGSFVNYK